MAAEAIIGLSSSPEKEYSTPAANGMAITLYPKAQKRFCLMMWTDFAESLINAGI